MFDVSNISANKEIQIQATGFDLHNLLYDWLEKVLLVILIDSIILLEFKVKIFEEQDLEDHHYVLLGNAKGECLNFDKHYYKVEVKGITYHEMEVQEEEKRVRTRFLLDL
jgi:SHS2 domain-containing protein